MMTHVVPATLMIGLATSVFEAVATQKTNANPPVEVQTPSATTRRAPVDQLKQGERKRNALTQLQLLRVRVYTAILSQVDPLSFGEHVDNLLRDSKPDEEIQTWEQVALAFAAFYQTQKPPLEGQRYAYRVLLLRTAQSEAEVFESLKIANDLQPMAKTILNFYPWEPIPITVRE